LDKNSDQVHGFSLKSSDSCPAHQTGNSVVEKTFFGFDYFLLSKMPVKLRNFAKYEDYIDAHLVDEDLYYLKVGHTITKVLRTI
jgi:hypothetical protein